MTGSPRLAGLRKRTLATARFQCEYRFKLGLVQDDQRSIASPMEWVIMGAAVLWEWQFRGTQETTSSWFPGFEWLHPRQQRR